MDSASVLPLPHLVWTFVESYFRISHDSEVGVVEEIFEILVISLMLYSHYRSSVVDAVAAFVVAAASLVVLETKDVSMLVSQRDDAPVRIARAYVSDLHILRRREILISQCSYLCSNCCCLCLC